VAPASRPSVVLDVAGAEMGGAARWCAELNAYLDATADPVRVIGRGVPLTPGWLARRERLARGAIIAVAPNNVSFVMSGRNKRVLVRNALHFLYPWESELLRGMPRRWHAQVPIVRRTLARADSVVVPCTTMGERVTHHVPSVAGRLVVRPHPVSPAGPRRPADDPFVLVPVLPAPYKNLFPQLRLLAKAAAAMDLSAEFRVTALASELPDDLASDPLIHPIGPQPHDRLTELWRSASAVFFPSVVESFGYPLAEARVYGIPVIAVDSNQSREIAGSALRGYDPADVLSLADALERIGEPVIPDSRAFDRDSYFGWLFGDGDR
jgi:glycosyltransferase involved in cell wall biosynthesis